MEETSQRDLPEVPPAAPEPAPTAASEPVATSQSVASAQLASDASTSSPDARDGASGGEAHEGVAHEGVAHEGVAHEGVAHEGVAHEGVAHEGVAHEGVAHEGVADADHAEAGEHEAGGADDESAAGEGDAAKTPGKRKRRRRRKRKEGSSAGEVVAADGGGAAPVEPSRKKETHAPFAHRFFGGAGKRHAFAVGEVVAGRVQRVDHGVIVVDLFGKATAFADEYEPREVPPLPELPAGESGAAEATAPHELHTSSVVTPEQAAPDTGLAAEAAPHMDAGASVIEAAPQAAAEPASVEQPLAVPNIEATNVVESGAQSAAEAAHVAHDADTTLSGDAFAARDDAADEDAEEPEPAPVAEPPHEKPEPPALGQVFKGRVGAVSESGHIALINRIIDVPAVRTRLAEFRDQHKRVHGVVFGFNRGGFDVLVEGLRAFCPASAMSLDESIDPLEYVGKKLEFLLPASKAGGKDIIVSRRSILERLQRRKTKEFLRSLTPNQRFKGRVTAVRDFGLFVDIGGIEGLVHQSELSYAFGVKPSSVAKPGDEIDVQVLRVGGEPKRDKDSGKRDRLTRVSLSVKALLPDPWDSHADALLEGTIHKGKVVRATEFGAFIEIVPSIEGLLHITELGRDLKHANQAVREGEDIYVAVERVDRRARRISLSKLSASEVQLFEAGTLTRDEGAARNLRQGNNVKLTIERIEPRCVFARVAGTVGKRGRAFLPSSETGTERGSDLRKRFPIGSEIEAKIIGIDRDGSLKCSIKAMQIDEERQAVKNYRREAAKQGFGTFGDLLRAKLGEAQTKQ